MAMSQTYSKTLISLTFLRRSKRFDLREDIAYAFIGSSTERIDLRFKIFRQRQKQLQKQP